MRRCLMAILVVGLVSVNTREASAQPSAKDVAAYVALQSTPVGAHTPVMMPKANAFAFRVSQFSPKVGDGTTNLAGSYFMTAGSNALVGGTLGYSMPSCDACEGIFNAGLDLNSSIWSNASGAAIGMSGNLGWAKDEDVTALSAAIGVPLSISKEQSNKSRISAFIQPGFGFGRLSADAGSESGTRPIIGAGAAWQAAGGWALHAAFNKIMIEDGGNNFGLGFSYKLGN
jgi:hypothetical protein